MNHRLFHFVAVWSLLVASTTAARAVTIGASQDSFVYQFLTTTNFDSGSFSAFLPVGDTSTGHDTRSAIQFNLASLGFTPAQVNSPGFSAKLNLWAGNTEDTGFGVNPSPSAPITVNVYALSGAWNSATLTEGNLPAKGALFGSLSINGFNKFVSFDISLLVQQWLNGTLTNNGLLLESPTAVGSSPNWVVAGFDSSAGPNGAHWPTLTVIPEPSGMALAACGVIVIGAAGFRRRRGVPCTGAGN